MDAPATATPDTTADNQPGLRRWFPGPVPRLLAILAICAGLAAWVAHSRPLGVATEPQVDLERLPRFQDRKFKSQPYVRAAVALQAVGRDRACEQMMAFAERDRDAEQVFILCRMLFMKRGASEFRRPSLGEASLLAGTNYADWPLEPIELVDGVPFVITWGYLVAGEGLPPESYLSYCMTNCDWSTYRFGEQSRAGMKTALTKLLDSPKWQRPLEAQERERLTEQIE